MYVMSLFCMILSAIQIATLAMHWSLVYVSTRSHGQYLHLSALLFFRLSNDALYSRFWSNWRSEVVNLKCTVRVNFIQVRVLKRVRSSKFKATGTGSSVVFVYFCLHFSFEVTEHLSIGIIILWATRTKI